MGSLRAIEEVFLLAVFGVRSAGVGVWVGDFGGFAVLSDEVGVVVCY